MSDKRKEAIEAIRNRVKTLRKARKDAGLYKIEVWVKADLIDTVKGLDQSNMVEKKPPGRIPKPKDSN